MTLPREDVAAGIAARRELGPDYDAAFADAIVARIEEHLAVRQAARADAALPPPPGRRAHRAGRDRTFALVLVSLALSVPLTAVSATLAGPGAVLLVWLGLVVLNVSYMHRPRRD
ncbi:hypothetical protein [Actinomadura gamaensis]|uniref:DUF3040 domain-containing protein n=1 Tax=Actinomadura gamaensis TaxID=1763541 RepID=A0ABV9UDY5_9ACTN